MKKEKILLESIYMLQLEGKKGKKLPIWHYLLDFSLTALFLSAYAYGVYSIVTFII